MENDSLITIMNYHELNLILNIITLTLVAADIVVTGWIGFKAWYAVMKAVELTGVAKEVLETGQEMLAATKEYSRTAAVSSKETERVVKEVKEKISGQDNLQG